MTSVRIFSATLAMLVASPAIAQDATGTIPMWLGPSSQGPTNYVGKPMRSWKALKFSHLVRQQTDFSCGAAALATIFNHAYGRNTSEQQVLVNMLKVADPEIVRQKGFSLLDMKNYVKAIGMQGAGFEVPFSALRELKVPGIALLNIKGYKHFVVIRKAGNDYVQIGDPALGNRLMNRRDFEKSWNGVVFVVMGEGYDPNSVLKNPPPPLSARRLYDQRSPVYDAEASDFGIRSVTSFSL